MRAIPPLPFTTPVDVASWNNFHHTISGRHVPASLAPGAGPSAAGASLATMQAQSLNAILSYCLADPPERLCTIGSLWSLSNILSPANVVLDPGIWNQIDGGVNPDWFTDAYKVRLAAGFVPLVVQGATRIREINNFLGGKGLALRTTGASDGHRIAGCIGTGTHGAHPKVGAVHDTVLGIYLVTGPDQAVFLQPSTRWFTPDLASALQAASGHATKDVADDDLFNAARVALGGLGFVHSVVMEAEALYQLSGLAVGRTLNDDDLWSALDALDSTKLQQPPDPDFLSFVFAPYAAGSGTGAVATMLWKKKPVGAFTPANNVPSAISSDLSRLLTALLPAVDGGLVGDALSALITLVTSKQYPVGPVPPTFPGSYFGPTSLPEGNGRSSEIVVDHVNAVRTVKLIIATLRTQAGAGRHLLGGMGVRTVPATTALLGANIHPLTTYIELPCLGTDKVTTIYNAVWAALRSNGIPFTCHWGQEYGMDANSIRAYYGDRIDRWIAARNTLLPTAAARAVFTNPLLEGLKLA